MSEARCILGATLVCQRSSEIVGSLQVRHMRHGKCWSNTGMSEVLWQMWFQYLCRIGTIAKVGSILLCKGTIAIVVSTLVCQRHNVHV